MRHFFLLPVFLSGYLYSVELIQQEFPLLQGAKQTYIVFSNEKQPFQWSPVWHFDHTDSEGQYSLQITREARFEGEAQTLIGNIQGGRGVRVDEDDQGKRVVLVPLIHSSKGREMVETSIVLEIQGGQFAKEGIYRSQHAYHLLYEGKVIQEGNLFATIEVDSQGEMMISDGIEASFTSTKYVSWDFGVIEFPQTKNAHVQVRSNFPFSLQIESQGRGELTFQDAVIGKRIAKDAGRIHVQDATSQEPVPGLPYQLYLGGEYIDLRGGVVDLQVNQTSLDGSINAYDLAITIQPDLKKHFAGTYKDQIFFTITNME